MIIGKYLFHPGAATPVYSPTFGRRGLAANFSVDVSLVSGNPLLVITLEHKNHDETAFTAAGTFANITAAGVATKDFTDLKEELRLVYHFTTGSAGDFLHIVVGTPAWRPYA